MYHEEYKPHGQIVKCKRVAQMTSNQHLVEAAERSPIRDQAGQAGCKAGVGEVARPQVILWAVAEMVALLKEESGHA